MKTMTMRLAEATEAEQSLDAQIDRVRDAWRSYCTENPFAGYRDTWASEVYTDHAIVRMGEDFYSIPYSEVDGEIVFDTATPTKVERTWVTAEGSGGFEKPIAEADGETDGSKWDVIIIRTGKSKNGRRYRESVLKESAALFEGARVLARSDQEHISGEGKSVLNVVGWIEGVRYERKALRATLNLVDEALRTKILEAWNRGKKDLVGLSLVAEGTGRTVTEAGQKVQDVEAITRVSSVDLVFDPAAGGGLVRLVAAEGKEEEPMLQKLIERLREAAANKADQIPGLLKGVAEAMGYTVDEVIALVVAEDPALTEALDKAKAEPAKTEPAKEPVKVAEAAGGGTGEGDEGLVPAVLGRMVLKQELAEAETLPDPVKKRIEKRFAGKAFKLEDLTEAISDEVASWAEIEKSNGLRSNGSGHRVEVGLEETTKALVALDGFFFDEDLEIDGQKVKRYRSFREAYTDLTGDREITGQLPRQRSGKLGISVAEFGMVKVPITEAVEEKGVTKIRIAEAGELVVSTWAQILGDSITRKMQADYRMAGLDDWRLLADVVPAADFRTNRRMRFGGYGDLAAVAEIGAYVDMTTPGDEEATYAVTKRGGIDVISLEAITNDDVGAIRQIPTRMGRAAARTLYKFVLSALFGANPTCTYDSLALFHATHANLGSTALSVATLSAARVNMYEQTDMSTNEQLGVVPRHLWVPIELEQTAYELLRSDRKPATADNDANYVGSFGIDYHSVLYFTDANNWFLSADKGDVPIIEIAFLNGKEEPELFTQDLPNVGSMFNNDTLTLKIRHMYGGGNLDHRGVFGAVVA